MKKSKEETPKEVQNKKKANTSPYLCTLSDRLQKLRTEKGLSQQELAKKAGTIREKIMFAELNMQGRVLKADELAEVAKALETTPDYLLGISSSLTSNNNNGLSDTTNNLAHKMGDNKISLLDKIIPEAEGNKQLDFLQTYIIVAYINKNILPYIMNEIRLKIENNKELSSADIQKTEFLLSYLAAFRQQQVGYSDFINYIRDKHDQTFINAYEETAQIFAYNTYKQAKIDYSIIEAVRPILSEFEKYAEYELYKRQEKATKDVIYEYIKDDTYFNEIKQYHKELTIQRKEEQQGDTSKNQKKSKKSK